MYCVCFFFFLFLLSDLFLISGRQCATLLCDYMARNLKIFGGGVRLCLWLRIACDASPLGIEAERKGPIIL